MTKNDEHELNVMKVKGVDYNLADIKCRKMVNGIIKNIENSNKTMDMYREGILELADSLGNLRNNEAVRKTCLTVDDVSSFPILRFTTDFSVLVDITVIVNGEIYSCNQLIKSYKGKVYRSIIDENCMVDCYYQINTVSEGVTSENSNSEILIYFDIHFDKYDLIINTL